MLRYSYTRNVTRYIKGVFEDGDIIDEQEELTAFDRASEYLMLGMRTTWGISKEEYMEVYRSAFDRLRRRWRYFGKTAGPRTRTAAGTSPPVAFC